MTSTPWVGTTPGTACAPSSPGFGVSGFAAADNLLSLGAGVTALDETEPAEQAEKADAARDPRRDVRLGRGTTARCPDDVDLLVTSPGWRPVRAAAGAGRGPRRPGLGGGRARLAAPRPRARTPVAGRHRHQRQDHDRADARLDPARRRPAQRRGRQRRAARSSRRSWTRSPTTSSPSSSPASSSTTPARCAPSPPRCSTSPRTTSTGTTAAAMADYAADKGRIYERVQRAGVYNVADPETEHLVGDADVVEGARAIGFTLGMPAVGMVGVVEDFLADRAFIEERASTAAELCTIADLASPAPAPLRGQRAGRGRARPRPRRPAGRGARRAAPLQARRPPDRDVAERAGVTGSTTPRPPTRTPRMAPCRPTSRSCGSPAGSPRARRSTTWCRAVARPAARRRAPRSRPPGHRRRAFATRARCAGHRRDTRDRDEVTWVWRRPHGRVVAGRSRACPPRRHRAAGAGCASMDMFADYGARGDAFAAAVRADRLGLGDGRG